MDLRDINHGSLLPEDAPEIFIPPALNSRGHPWPDEHVKLLRAEFTDHSGSELAALLNAKFGTNYTRNAVIGKCCRLGLMGVGKSKRRPTISPSPRRERRHYTRRTFRRKFDVGERSVEIEAEFVCDPVSLLDLKENHCRWPVSGEATTIMFCGADKLEPYSYCTRHCRMAYDLPKIKTAAEFELYSRQARRLYKQSVTKAA